MLAGCLHVAVARVRCGRKKGNLTCLVLIARHVKQERKPRRFQKVALVLETSRKCSNIVARDITPLLDIGESDSSLDRKIVHGKANNGTNHV